MGALRYERWRSFDREDLVGESAFVLTSGMGGIKFRVKLFHNQYNKPEDSFK
jgi:hypothetical protein